MERITYSNAAEVIARMVKQNEFVPHVSSTAKPEKFARFADKLARAHGGVVAWPYRPEGGKAFCHVVNPTGKGVSRIVFSR